jgi:hypothetical protein
VTQSTTAIDAQPGSAQDARGATTPTLRLLGGGLVAIAVAFAIQTAVYRVVAEDAFAATLTGIDFAFADGAVLVALIRLARDSELRPFALPAAWLTGLLVVGDVAAVAAHIAGPAPDWLRLLDRAQGDADAALRAGATLLVLFTLWVLAQGHRLRAAVPVAWTVPVALVLSIALSFVGTVVGGRGVASAWVGLLLVIARPAALGALAFELLRVRERAARSAGPPAQGVYREPERPSGASPPWIGPLPALQAAASGLRTVRQATLARMLLTAGLVGAILSLAAASSAPPLTFATLALISAATSLALLFGLGRLLPLARATRSRVRLGVVLALRALGCLADLTVFVGIALSGRSDRPGQAWVAEVIPIGVLASFLGASAMLSIGRRLGAPAVVRDARWVVASIVLAGGMVFGGAMTARGDFLPDGILVGSLLVMGVATFAVQGLHARLVSRARAAIVEEIARATR